MAILISYRIVSQVVLVLSFWSDSEFTNFIFKSYEDIRLERGEGEHIFYEKKCPDILSERFYENSPLNFNKFMEMDFIF